ncbi:hypothetical protein [Streptomyces sp. bgisy034]|uniref:hypothetical protein n=1 Tax=Streptomyces sp. bgisy034 TaxID=3413774 RepID=UPI003EB9D689
MSTLNATVGADVPLVDPGPDVPVVPVHRRRPGVREDEVSRFGDLRWELAHLEHKDTTSTKAFLWSNFPASLRDPFMRIAWALINISTPDVLHARLGARSRSVVSASSVMTALTGFRKFARWLDARSVMRLTDVDQPILAQYAAYLGEKGFTDGHDERQLFALTRVWAYAPHLLPEDRLVMPPWEDPGAAIIDFLGDDFSRERGENKEVVIHPATMSPLLIWALRLVLDLAPDIIDAHWAWRRLKTNIRPRDAAAADGLRLVRAYLQHLKASGGSLPAYIGSTGQHLGNHWRADAADERPLINISFLAGQLGVTRHQVEMGLLELGPDFGGLTVADGAALAVDVTGRIDGDVWAKAIDFTEAQPLAGHLMTAALLAIGYLSGMRPEEVLHLERGCCIQEEREAGTVRYRITGRHFKGVTDEDGNTLPGGEIRPEPWTVIELVDRAVKVLEQLHDDRLLFPRSLTVRTLEPAAAEIRAEGLNPNRFIERIKSFIGWANATATRLGRPHELIPADPHGPITLRRLRRTVAWFIYRRPGGRIALGLQYGHVGSSLAESYGGRTKADMLEILDFEKTLALADALAEANDRLSAGEAVSGPAADRYIAAGNEFTARYAGGFATKGQMKALRNNPRLQIFEDPQALLTCNLDPYKALCDPDLAKDTKPSMRTPNWNRCNPACANISRTDTHMQRAHEQLTQIDTDCADPYLPHPIRRRLELCRASTEKIIEAHEAAAGRTADKDPT